MTYDDAIFMQYVKRVARNGVVTREQVEAAFWVAAWDVELAIEQQAPEKMARARELVRREYLPILAELLVKHGITMIDGHDERASAP